MDEQPPRGSEPTGASDGRTLEQLRQAVRARDAFVAIAAHELRNPMTPILMQVHALLHAAADPKATVPPAILAGLERLERAVEVYGRRASTLLQVSRINAGQLELCPVELDLSRLVLDAVERHAPMAAFVGSCLDTAVEDGLVGLLDEVALEQILDNLLSNALKYGAGQPVVVALRADGALARLTVRDHGIGIPPEHQARIFAPFERLMAVRGPGGGGFGVGLWVVRQLAEALGGTVTIESAPAAGSTFTVVLPLGPAVGKGSAP